MHWKSPKNSDKYYWTEHVKIKMRQYGLSAQRITRVIKSPMRIEGGVTGNTVAVVQPQSTRRGENGEKTWTNEIWVMYQLKNNSSKIDDTMDEKMKKFLMDNSQNSKQIKIISTWRYPGKTVPGEGLPEEILDEIAEVA
ncbi:MAG: hypothetical protein ACKUBY_05720 [Candidatus Moraniibacteriota bacterium]|jgi:hypothetical protein